MGQALGWLAKVIGVTITFRLSDMIASGDVITERSLKPNSNSGLTKAALNVEIGLWNYFASYIRVDETSDGCLVSTDLSLSIRQLSADDTRSQWRHK